MNLNKTYHEFSKKFEQTLESWKNHQFDDPNHLETTQGDFRIQEILQTLAGEVTAFKRTLQVKSSRQLNQQCSDLLTRIAAASRWIEKGMEFRREFHKVSDSLEESVESLNEETFGLEYGLTPTTFNSYADVVGHIPLLFALYEKNQDKAKTDPNLNKEMLNAIKNDLQLAKSASCEYASLLQEDIPVETAEIQARFEATFSQISEVENLTEMMSKYGELSECVGQLKMMNSSLEEGIKQLRSSWEEMAKRYTDIFKPEAVGLFSLRGILNPIQNAKSEIQKEYLAFIAQLDRDIQAMSKLQQSIARNFATMQPQFERASDYVAKRLKAASPKERSSIFDHLFSATVLSDDPVKFARQIAPLLFLKEYLSQTKPSWDFELLLQQLTRTCSDANKVHKFMQTITGDILVDVLYTPEVLAGISLAQLSSIQTQEKARRMNKKQKDLKKAESYGWTERQKVLANRIFLGLQLLFGVQFLCSSYSRYERVQLEIRQKEAQSTEKCVNMIQISLEVTPKPSIDPEKVLQAAVFLDQYAALLKEATAEKVIAEASVKKGGDPLTPKESAEITDSANSKVGRAIVFFCSSPPQKVPPLIKIMENLSLLHRPKDPSLQKQFDASVGAFAESLLKSTFDQHVENPEQYVSHGFDHSLNVSEYARTVLEMNPKLIIAIQKKYHISENEALFIMQSLAMLHDIGYPAIGSKSKATHGVAGADIASGMLKGFDKMITTPGADIEQIKSDIYNAIFFHSADKVETFYDTQIITDKGNLLIDHNNVEKVLGIIGDPDKSPGKFVRVLSIIQVQDEAMKTKVEETLKKFDLYDTVQVTIHEEGLFAGRSVDLVAKKDKLAGLEYSQVDLMESPLLGILRLTDNFDMTESRFSLLQQQPTFKEIYRHLGAKSGIYAPMSRLAEMLEATEGEAVKIAKEHAALGSDRTVIERAIQENYQNKLREGVKNLNAGIASGEYQGLQPLQISETQVSGIDSYDDLDHLFKDALVDSLVKDKPIPADTIDHLREMAIYQNSVSFRHFGGCEALRSVTLHSSESAFTVVITVDSVKFEENNLSVVPETSRDNKGNLHSVKVPVGRYQIWRAEEAFAEIRGGGGVRVSVIDEYGSPIDRTDAAASKDLA